MTTSPATPSTPQTSNQGQLLLSDRAASIGWYFIESYYDFYNKSIESIYKLYHTNASICHASFPSKDDESRTLHKACGIEAIKRRFQNDAALKEGNNRIVVTSADIQVCLQDKILIVVFGEWSKNNSQFWQFTQTFLLCPGKNENTFDLANDNLRFIDFEEYKKPLIKQEGASESEASKEKPSAEEIKSDVPKQTKTKDPETTVPISNGEHKLDIENTENTKAEPKDVKETETKIGGTTSEAKPTISNEPKPVPNVEPKKEEMVDKTMEPKPEPKPESKPEPRPDAKIELTNADSKSESKAEPESEQKPEQIDEELYPSTSSRPISWAALAAQQPQPLAKLSVLSPAKVPVTLAGKKSPPMNHNQQTQPPVQIQQPQPTSNGKYKKEDWFPIYIRGVKDINEDKLKNHLTKKFGEIKFFRVFVNIALCDFVDGEAQKNALETKEAEVDGYVIQLEVRESKTHTGNKANVKTSKDKNSNGTSNEKRGRNDKKQNSKKNRSSSRNLD